MFAVKSGVLDVRTILPLGKVITEGTGVELVYKCTKRELAVNKRAFLVLEQ